VLGLVARAAPLRSFERERVMALARHVPEEHWPLRVDVLSVHEALAGLGVNGTPQ